MNRFYKLFAQSLLLCLLSYSALYAQSEKLPKNRSDIPMLEGKAARSGWVSYELDEAPRFSPSQLNITYLDAQGQQQSFRAKEYKLLTPDALPDVFGITHYTYQQTINGVPVEGAWMKAHVKQGKLIDQNGNWLPEPPSDLRSAKAAITKERAVKVAADLFGGEKKMPWNRPAMEADYQKLTDNPDATRRPSPELVFFPTSKKPETLDPDSLLLAWKFKLYLAPLKSYLVYVNAQNGQLIDSISTVCSIGHHSTIPCTTQNCSGEHQKNNVNNPLAWIPPVGPDYNSTLYTRYSGMRKTSTDNYNSQNQEWLLVDTDRGIQICNALRVEGTADDQGRLVLLSSAPWYSNRANTWIYNPSLDGYAQDAFWAAQKTVDFYKQSFKEFRYKGAKSFLPLRIFNNADAELLVGDASYNVNAFHDGADVFLFKGAGNITPLSALDVVAHEITHGVTAATSGLAYYAEPGAINEAFSDVMGLAIEKYARPERWNYTIGEDIGAVFRSFSNPKAYRQPQEYFGANFLNYYFENVDNGGVHINSGVVNYWFYLLCEGKTATTERGNRYSIQPIGIDKAIRIVYLAKNYLTQNSGFFSLRAATERAASILYGSSSLEYKMVTAAWDAVEVKPSQASPLGTCADILEPNNTPAAAQPITIGQQYKATVVIKKVFDEISLSKKWNELPSYLDADFYKFTTTSDKPNFKITLGSNLHDVVVFGVIKQSDASAIENIEEVFSDYTGTLLTGATVGASSTKLSSSTSYNALKKDDYIILVFSTSSSKLGQGNCYTLKVETQSNPFPVLNVRENLDLPNMVQLMNETPIKDDGTDKTGIFLLGIENETISSNAKVNLRQEKFTASENWIFEKTGETITFDNTISDTYWIRNADSDQYLTVDENSAVLFKKLAVFEEHLIYGIGKNDQRIYKQDLHADNPMPQELPGNGLATEIAVSANGTVYVIGLDNRVYRFTGSGWSPYDGTYAKKIAADPQGNWWCIGSDNCIYRWRGSTWEKISNWNFLEISIGSAGDVYTLGADRYLYKWNENAKSFEQLQRWAFKSLVANAFGNCILLGTDSNFYLYTYSSRSIQRIGSTTFSVVEISASRNKTAEQNIIALDHLGFLRYIYYESGTITPTSGILSPLRVNLSPQKTGNQNQKFQITLLEEKISIVYGDYSKNSWLIHLNKVSNTVDRIFAAAYIELYKENCIDGNYLDLEDQCDSYAGTHYGSDKQAVFELIPSKQISSGRYWINSAHNNLPLGTSNGALGNPVILKSKDYKDLYQQWDVKYLGAGYYKFTNLGSGKSLDLAGAVANDGQPFIQWAYSGTANQQFKILPGGYDPEFKTWKIVNRSSNKPLHHYMNDREGKTVNQWSYHGVAWQRWQFVPIKLLKEGYYFIQNRQTSRYLDIAGASKEDGARAIAWGRHGGYNQLFYVKPIGNGEYHLTAVHSGKFLTSVADGNGASVVQYHNNYNEPNRKWRIRPIQGGSFYRLENVNNGRVLDNFSADFGNPAYIWDDVVTAPWQEWRFIPLGAVVGGQQFVAEGLSDSKALKVTTFDLSDTQPQLKVSPNPIAQNESINVLLTNLQGDNTLQLIDVSGKIVWSRSVQSDQSLFQFKMDTPATLLLKSGMYILSAYGPQGRAITKFLVQ